MYDIWYQKPYGSMRWVIMTESAKAYNGNRSRVEDSKRETRICEQKKRATKNGHDKGHDDGLGGKV